MMNEDRIRFSKLHSVRWVLYYREKLNIETLNTKMNHYISSNKGVGSIFRKEEKYSH